MRWPARIALKPSARLVVLIAAIHAIAAIAFLHLSMHPAWVLFLLLAIGLSAALAIRAELGIAGTVLRLEERGRVHLEDTDGIRTATLLPTSTDFGWAVWIQWLEDSGRARRGARMLLSDGMAPDDWRTLRVWMRHSGEEPVGDVRDAR